MFVFSAILLTLLDPRVFLFSLFAFSVLLMFFPRTAISYQRINAEVHRLQEVQDVKNLVTT